MQHSSLVVQLSPKTPQLELDGDLVTGALVGVFPPQVESVWLTQITALPVVRLIDSTLTVIRVPLILPDVQLPPAFNLATRSE